MNTAPPPGSMAIAETPSPPPGSMAIAETPSPPAGSVAIEPVKASLGDKAGAFWDGLTSNFHPIDAITSMGSMIRHPGNTLDEIQQGREQTVERGADALKHGDYAPAALHGALSLIPLIGPALSQHYKEMRDAQNAGDEVGESRAAGKMLGMAATGEALRAIPEVPGAVGDIAGKAKQLAQDHPEVLTNVGRAVGAYAGHEAGVGPWLGGYVGGKLAEGVGGMIGPKIPPLYDQVAQGLGAKDFASAPSSVQDLVRGAVAKANGNGNMGKAAPGPDFKPSVGTPELQAQFDAEKTRTPRTIQQVIDEEIAARKARPPAGHPLEAQPHPLAPSGVEPLSVGKDLTPAPGWVPIDESPVNVTPVASALPEAAGSESIPPSSASSQSGIPGTAPSNGVGIPSVSGTEVHVNPLDDYRERLLDHRRRLENEINRFKRAVSVNVTPVASALPEAAGSESIPPSSASSQSGIPGTAPSNGVGIPSVSGTVDRETPPGEPTTPQEPPAARAFPAPAPGEGTHLDIQMEPGEKPVAKDYQAAARKVWAGHFYIRLKAMGYTPEDFGQMTSQQVDDLAKDIGINKSSPEKLAQVMERFKAEGPDNGPFQQYARKKRLGGQ